MADVDVSSDPGALALELFERHRAALRAYLRLATGRSDIAEDLAQDVYLRVVRGEAAYQPRGKERAWLFSIARHLVVDHFRRRSREVPLRDAARPAAQTHGTSLREALVRLPDREREAFLLCEVGGLSYAEIATATASTIPAVRSAIYRARMQLRAEVLAPPPMLDQPTRSISDDD